MNKKIELNDLKIEDFNEEVTSENLADHAEGHGLSEMGASCQSGSNSCGQGSCSVAKAAN